MESLKLSHTTKIEFAMIAVQEFKALRTGRSHLAHNIAFPHMRDKSILHHQVPGRLLQPSIEVCGQQWVRKINTFNKLCSGLIQSFV